MRLAFNGVGGVCGLCTLCTRAGSVAAFGLAALAAWGLALGGPGDGLGGTPATGPSPPSSAAGSGGVPGGPGGLSVGLPEPPGAGAAAGAEPSAPSGPSGGGALATGRVVACEHFAFLRASLIGGVGGPAREALKSWDGEMGGAFAPNGDYYQIDVNSSIIFRIRDGVARVLAGDGTRGWRDGPADQAQFDFGVGGYSDAGIACDRAGNVYVSEALVGRLRRLSRGPDGILRAETLAGGGQKMPAKGQSIPAGQMKHGCASRFALTPDGTVYFASYGGVYRVKDGQGACLADAADLRRDLGEKAAIADWHVGGSHITPDGVFYWMPGGGPDVFRLDTRTGRADRFAGIRRIEQGLDGPTLLESGFHTVLVVYAPDASAIFTCGGDESVPRRIAGGRVTTLRRDGRFRPFDQAQRADRKADDRWKSMAAVQCLDAAGRLYACTGDYGWGGWIVRFTFGPEEQP